MENKNEDKSIYPSTSLTANIGIIGKETPSQILKTSLTDAIAEKTDATPTVMEHNNSKEIEVDDSTANRFHVEQMIDQIIQAYTDGRSDNKISEHAIIPLETEPSIKSNISDSSQSSVSKITMKERSQHCCETVIMDTIEEMPSSSCAIGIINAADTQEDRVVISTQDETPTTSIRSIGSLVCRICHNAENPEYLVSPCLCKGSLTYVHVQCLERWIATSRSTRCELCKFQYNTQQTLRYTCFQSLRMWYSRALSRRALQEDCQMLSLLTLVAFGIIGTLIVGMQYYFSGGTTMMGINRLWTKAWLLVCLFITLIVYILNVYMILKQQLIPWFRWWQSARDIRLVLENRRPFTLRPDRRNANRPLFVDIPPCVNQSNNNNAENNPTNNNNNNNNNNNIPRSPQIILDPNRAASVEQTVAALIQQLLYLQDDCMNPNACESINRNTAIETHAEQLTSVKIQ